MCRRLLLFDRASFTAETKFVIAMNFHNAYIYIEENPHWQQDHRLLNDFNRDSY